MRNNETMSGNTGSLPKSMQFLHHGTPGPMPGKSEAELERAEQAEYNLFVEDSDAAEASAAEASAAEDLSQASPEEIDAALAEDRTASIARLVASVFAGAQASGIKPAAQPEQTASTPEIVATADASRPLPQFEAPEPESPVQEPADASFYSRILQQTGRASYTEPDGTDALAYDEGTYGNAAFPAADAGASYTEAPYTEAQPGGSAGQTRPQPAAPAGKAKKPDVRTAKAVSGKTPKNASGKTPKPGVSNKKSSSKAAAKPDRVVLVSSSAGSPLQGAGAGKIADTGGVRETASFRQMLLDIRERQQDALPAQDTTVRSAVKQLQLHLRIDRVLNPVRYVIILLMVLCLAGRKYEWMTLGFMSGMQGVRVAIFMTVLSMFVSWQSAKRSVQDIAFLKPSYETWLLVASLLTIEEAAAYDNARSLVPLLAISWCFSGIADYRNNLTRFKMDQAMIRARKRTGLLVREGGKKDRSVIGKSKASTFGFARHQEEPDLFHKIWMLAGPCLFILILLLTAFVSGRTGKKFMTVLVLLMDMATPTSLVLCCARPLELFVGTTRRHGVVAGWYGLQRLAGKRSMLLYDSDFYPSGSIQKKDVRLYTPIDIVTFISYACCLGLKGEIGYREMFIDMMREANGTEVKVSGLKVFERGVQGRIHNETVFLGSYEFMQLEGFDLPPRASRDSLFLAVDRKLAGEIVISYQVKRGASNAFRHLTREPGLYTMVAARNFMITPGYIRKTFKTNVSKVVCHKAANRRKLAQSEAFENAAVCGYIFHEGITSYGMIVSGARRTLRAGFWMTILSILAAVILMIRTALTLTGGYASPLGTGLILLNLILLLGCELISRLSAGNPE